MFFISKKTLYIKKEIYSVFLSFAFFCNIVRIESDNCSI